MISDTVDLGSGYVLSISAPKDDENPWWSLDLTYNGIQWGQWTFPDIEEGDPTDLEAMIDITKSWLYSRIGKLVDEKFPRVEETFGKLVNEYRL